MDIFIPDKYLAFEYQGEHHYIDLYGLGNRWERKERDDEKRTLCLEKGITLVEVPYWWDFKKESLMATIQKEKPHIFKEKIEASPIPSLPPEGFPSSSTQFKLVQIFLTLHRWLHSQFDAR